MKKIKLLITFSLLSLSILSPVQAATKKQVSFISDQSGNKQIYLINEDGTGLTNISVSGFNYNTIEGKILWSPDGNKIAFQKKEKDLFNLYIMDLKNKKIVSIPSGSQYDISMEWSPNSSTLAFNNKKFDKDAKIYLIDSNGTNLRLLNDNNTDQTGPKWSPDSQKIAFITSIILPEYNAENRQVVIVDKDGKNLIDLSGGILPTLNDSPQWSPDSRKITFTSARDGDFEIFIADVNGENIKNITNNSVYDGSSTWSPDGKQIVFSSTRNTLKADKNYPITEIFIMDLESYKTINLTPQINEAFLPIWSPDSKKISFSTMPDDNDLNNFHLINPNGTELSKPFIGFNSSWSPNGKQMLFSNPSTPNGKEDIYLMDIKSYKIKKLVTNGSSPIWRP